MALRGTLGDFALTDILQLIGLQRKSGILELRRAEERVRVGFRQGRVVSAETSGRPQDETLGQLLSRRGQLTEMRLGQALDVQKRTLEPLGRVLLKNEWVDRESLQRSLSLQLSETIFELFRWGDGEYDFEPMDEKDVDWDEELIVPISSETLLMEGAQMVDEWPLIERVVPSKDVVLKSTPRAAHVLATTKDVKEARGSVYDEDLDFGFIPENPLGEEADRPRFTEVDIAVLRWVDGRRTAGEISELSGLGTFETFKTITNLVESGLVEIDKGGSAVRGSIFAGLLQASWPARGLVVAASVLAAVGALGLARDLAVFVGIDVPAGARWPATLSSSTEVSRALEIDKTRAALSSVRMERIEQAVRTFILDRGRHPKGLQELVNLGLLRAEQARAPWGEPYRFEIGEWGFLIAEPGAVDRPALQREYRFTRLERSLGV
jgi:hypothetical protein